MLRIENQSRKMLYPVNGSRAGRAGQYTQAQQHRESNDKNGVFAENAAEARGRDQVPVAGAGLLRVRKRGVIPAHDVFKRVHRSHHIIVNYYRPKK